MERKTVRYTTKRTGRQRDRNAHREIDDREDIKTETQTDRYIEYVSGQLRAVRK